MNIDGEKLLADLERYSAKYRRTAIESGKKGWFNNAAAQEEMANQSDRIKRLIESGDYTTKDGQS